MSGLWFEELTEGRVIDAEWTRTVTEIGAERVLGTAHNRGRSEEGASDEAN